MNMKREVLELRDFEDKVLSNKPSYEQKTYGITQCGTLQCKRYAELAALLTY
jgi:hypothetical protein